MVRVGNCDNVDYADVVFDSKNVYMGYFVVFDCEDVLYTFVARENCKRVFNSVMVFKNSENIYWSNGVVECFNIFYSKYVYNCSDIWFSTNVQGCHHCILCDGLENASYCIRNEQYTKEDYEIEKAKFLTQKGQFEEWFDALSHQARSFWCSEVDGGFLIDCENVQDGYFSYNIRNAHNIMFQWGEKMNEEVYDMFIGGALYGTHMYANQGMWGSEHAYFCHIGVHNSNVFYCMTMDTCSYCFGCIGLRNKQYCILNKQYTKEVWHRLVDQIFASMEQEWTFWQFFPGWMCPYYFNDTCSVLIDDSLSKQEVEAAWYLWREEEIKVDIPEWMEVVEVSELGEYEGNKSPQPPFIKGGDDASSWGDGQIWWIDPAILKKVIRDEEGNVYRVIKMEYDFLMKYGLPLPRKHRLERLKGHFRVK